MKTPKFKNEFKDKKTGVTYLVYAYRKLKKQEGEAAIKFYLRTHKRKPKPDSTVTIYTMLGDE